MNKVVFQKTNQMVNMFSMQKKRFRYLVIEQDILRICVSTRIQILVINFYVYYINMGFKNQFGLLILTDQQHELHIIIPINITLDNPDDIYWQENTHDLFCIALHGDYTLKNTTTELDSQQDTFKNRLKEYYVDKNLIVIGYSGRDS